MELSGWEVINALHRYRNDVDAARSLSVSVTDLHRSLRNFEHRFVKCVHFNDENHVELTEYGRFLVENISKAHDRFRESYQMLLCQDKSYDTIKITAGSSTYGNFACWIINRVREEFPHMRFDMRIEDANLDVVMEQSDIGITLEEFTHIGSNSVVNVCEVAPMIHDPIGIYASSRYIEQFGMPETLDDLHRHRIVVVNRSHFYGNAYVSKMYSLLLYHGVQEDCLRSPLMVFSDMSVLFHAVKIGVGIAWLPQVFRPLKNGLVRLLQNVEMPSLSRSVVARQIFVQKHPRIWQIITDMCSAVHMEFNHEISSIRKGTS